MSIHLELENLDALFASLSTPPLIANNVDVVKKEEKEKLNRLMMTHYDGDSLDIVPSCDCGKVRGEYNVGIRCKACGTTVTVITERPLESIMWITTIDKVDTLINPMAWNILSEIFTIKYCNFIEYFTNPDYKPPTRIPELNLIPPTWGRGLNYFYRNFDMIMSFMIDGLLVSTSRIALRPTIIEFLNQNRDLIFCKYIPFPSRLGFITESSPVGTYVDITIREAIDAIRTITSANRTVSPVSQRNREIAVVKAISLLASYYKNFIYETCGKKKGVFRKHIFGNRGHFTGRAVITSIVEEHDYDELHIPWGYAVQLLRTHLASKLLRRGLNPRETTAILYESVNCYNPLIDSLFQELIAEAPHKGIPASFGRNPTLSRGFLK